MYNEIIKIIIKAGNFILENIENININDKSKFDFVTNLDIDVQNFIIENVHKYNNDKFISEEIDDDDIHIKDGWILDPIDGTTNLINHYNSSCISLAHVKNNIIQFGCVYNPFSNELFYATKGNGAYLIKDQNKRQIFVSTDTIINKKIVACGFPYDRTKIKNITNIINNILLEVSDVKRNGPASLDICYVACGRYIAYFEQDLKVWDYAAAKLILEESGGKITNWNGDDIDGKSNILACSNNAYEKIIKIIKK